MKRIITISLLLLTAPLLTCTTKHVTPEKYTIKIISIQKIEHRSHTDITADFNIMSIDEQAGIISLTDIETEKKINKILKTKGLLQNL